MAANSLPNPLAHLLSAPQLPSPTAAPNIVPPPLSPSSHQSAAPQSLVKFRGVVERNIIVPFHDPRFKVAGKISTLLNNSTNSDITIITSDSTHIPAHLSILGLHTQWFSAATSSTSAFTESTARTVSFPEHTTAAVKSTLEFCYKYGYDLYTPDKSVLDHFDVFLLADFLMIDELKLDVLENLKAELGLEKLKEQVQGKLQLWGEVLPELVLRVYGNTVKEDRIGAELRKRVVEAVSQGLVTGDGLTVEPFRGVMSEVEDFAADVVEAGVKGAKVAAGSRREETFGVGMFKSQPPPSTNNFFDAFKRATANPRPAMSGGTFGPPPNSGGMFAPYVGGNNGGGRLFGTSGGGIGSGLLGPSQQMSQAGGLFRAPSGNGGGLFGQANGGNHSETGLFTSQSASGGLIGTGGGFEFRSSSSGSGLNVQNPISGLFSGPPASSGLFRTNSGGGGGDLLASSQAITGGLFPPPSGPGLFGGESSPSSGGGGLFGYMNNN